MVASGMKRRSMSRPISARRTRSLASAIAVSSRWVPLGEIDAALPLVDYVVVCLPLSAETADLIDRPRLASMKQGSVLINVGRGGIVDEGALAELVEGGRIAQAALDVFEVEPLPRDDRLWGVPGIVVSPYIAGERSDYREAVAEIWLDNLARWLTGEPLNNPVSR